MFNPMLSQPLAFFIDLLYNIYGRCSILVIASFKDGEVIASKGISMKFLVQALVAQTGACAGS